MNCSVQLYTVRDALQTDLAGTIRRLAEICDKLDKPELAAMWRRAAVAAPSSKEPVATQGQEPEEKK